MEFRRVLFRSHANPVQTESEQSSKAGIDQDLHQQVSADTLRSVVEHLRHDVDLTESDQPEKAMSQVVSLDQHEDREDEDKSGHCQRPKNGLNQIANVLQFICRRLHDLYRQGNPRSTRRSALLPIQI